MTLRRLDFGRPARGPVLGWVVLLLGMVCLLASAWARQAWRQLDAAEAARVIARQAARDAAVASPRAVPSTSERRLAQARREMTLPWSRALSAVEAAATDPVYLLALSIEPGTGLVSLAAEAPSLEDALRFAEALEGSGALGRPLIHTHERQIEPAAGRPRIVFKLTTRWPAP